MSSSCQIVSQQDKGERNNCYVPANPDGMHTDSEEGRVFDWLGLVLQTMLIDDNNISDVSYGMHTEQTTPFSLNTTYADRHNADNYIHLERLQSVSQNSGAYHQPCDELNFSTWDIEAGPPTKEAQFAPIQLAFVQAQVRPVTLGWCSSGEIPFEKVLAIGPDGHPEGMRMRKWTARFEVQIQANSPFDVTRRIIGFKAVNVLRVHRVTNCKLRLRGRGSRHLEGQQRQEANEPLNLCVSGSKSYSLFLKACNMVEYLLSQTYAEYDQWRWESHGLPPLHTQVRVRQMFIADGCRRGAPLWVFPVEDTGCLQPWQSPAVCLQ